MISKKYIYKNYIKRLLDFILSLFALVLLSPLILTLMAIVWAKLGSPVIFKQQRPGLNEKIFTMYKLRTMTDERGDKGKLLADEFRITRFGRFLRSTSLDELPELINIIKGDMSIVGPRPLAVSYLDYYNEFEKQRHTVRPGLSGLAQVSGRNAISWEEKFAYDIKYINNITFIGDIKIVLKTIIVAFKRSNTDAAEDGSLENFSDYRLKQLNETR